VITKFYPNIESDQETKKFISQAPMSYRTNHMAEKVENPKFNRTSKKMRNAV
jgi:Golgi nucleoside diphosphatase